MSRIIIPGEPEPKPERLISPEIVSREFSRILRQRLALEMIWNLHELRQSMPRERDGKKDQS